MLRYDDSELLTKAGTLISKLRPEQQQAIQSDGFYDERAAKLGIPVGTVKSRIHRARKHLRKMIEERDAQ